jgi:hypothetical protein
MLWMSPQNIYRTLACIEKQKKNILARRLMEDYLYTLNRIRGILFFLLIEFSDLIISKTVNALRVSRAAILLKCASIQSASHNPFSPRY